MTIHSEDTRWTLSLAKSRLSEVVRRAQSEPQVITRNGIPSVVVVSWQEWQRKMERKSSLATFLVDSPLVDSDLELGRFSDEPDDLSL